MSTFLTNEWIEYEVTDECRQWVRGSAVNDIRKLEDGYYLLVDLNCVYNSNTTEDTKLWVKAKSDAHVRQLMEGDFD